MTTVEATSDLRAIAHNGGIVRERSGGHPHGRPAPIRVANSRSLSHDVIPDSRGPHRNQGQ
jgi:hypothetical protein